MSGVIDFIESASIEQRYPSNAEIEHIINYFTSGERRLRIVQRLIDSRDEIIKQASQQLFQKYPYIVLSDGDGYDETKVAAYFLVLHSYLRVAIYAMLTGDPAVIVRLDLESTQELYKSLGTPFSVVVEGIRSVQSVCTTLLCKEDAAETETYFNYFVDTFFANKEEIPEAQAARPIWE